MSADRRQQKGVEKYRDHYEDNLKESRENLEITGENEQ